MKDKIARFGVSLEGELLRKFDAYIRAGGYENRSKAIADLILREFVAEDFRKGAVVAGALTVVYDLYRRGAAIRLRDIQKEHRNVIISSQLAQLDRGKCLEIMAVKGRGPEVKLLADALKGVKGLNNATLSVTGAGK